MATWDWPTSLTPQTVAWGIKKAGVQFRSPMAGSVESVEFSGAFWTISITLREWKLRDGGEAEAFFARLAGGSERVRVPYWPRLVPQGTMRGSPVLAASAARGDLALAITTTGSLRAGDMISVSGQLLQVFQDCTSSSGTLTVPLVNRVRRAMSSGAGVTWDRPTVTCLVPSLSSSASYQPGCLSGMPVDLEEAP